VAAAYVPPATTVSVPPVSDAISATAPGAAPAAQLPSGAPVLADATLQTLVAQQAADGANPPAAAPLDLKGQDLHGVDLKSLDLRGADLSGADLSGVDLTGLDFSGATLSGANLSGANFTNTNLSNVSAEGADLSNANLVKTTLDGGDFTNAKFDNAFIGRADITPAQITSPSDLVRPNGVKLDGASFQGATLSMVYFNNSSAVGADFSGITANQAEFLHSNLQNANFDHAGGQSLGISDSDLSNAAMTNLAANHVGFGSTILDGTRFAGTSFDNMGFVADNLTTADLTGVVRSARDAIFANTNLSGLDLSGVDFTNALFSGAPRIWDDPQHRVVAGGDTSLAGTDFTGANLTNTLFDEIDTSRVKSFANTSFDPVKSTDVGSWNVNYAVSHGRPDPNDWVKAYVSTHGLIQNGNVYSDPGTVLAPAGASQTKSGAGTMSPPPSTGADAGMELALQTLTAVNDQLRAQADAAKSGAGRADAPGRPFQPKDAAAKPAADTTTVSA
jgi:uncharacterized protein YjbI with pentapeptide repeats